MPSSSSTQLKRERLHLRVDARLLGNVKRLSKRRVVTVTSLVEEGLRLILRQEELERDARRASEPSPIIDAEQV